MAEGTSSDPSFAIPSRKQWQTAVSPRRVPAASSLVAVGPSQSTRLSTQCLERTSVSMARTQQLSAHDFTPHSSGANNPANRNQTQLYAPIQGGGTLCHGRGSVAPTSRDIVPAGALTATLRTTQSTQPDTFAWRINRSVASSGDPQRNDLKRTQSDRPSGVQQDEEALDSLLRRFEGFAESVAAKQKSLLCVLTEGIAVPTQQKEYVDGDRAWGCAAMRHHGVCKNVRDGHSSVGAEDRFTRSLAPPFVTRSYCTVVRTAAGPPDGLPTRVHHCLQ